MNDMANTAVRRETDLDLWRVEERTVAGVRVEALTITRRGGWYAIRHESAGYTERAHGAAGLAFALRFYGVDAAALSAAGIA